MKTGKPTRLSEKLNAELDTIRAEHVASISSQLKSFRIVLKNTVGAAQHTLDRQDREGAGWLERLRDLAHSFTSRIHEGLERIAERRGELQDAERELAAELDLSESRRREIEGQLDSQEAHAERGLRH